MLTHKTILNAAVCLTMTVAASAESKSAPVNQDRNHVAVRGYDMVAYLTDGKPLKGDPKFTYTWQGASWRIADGKLYLNYSLSVQKQWLADPEGRIRRAYQNWPALHY